MLKKNIFRYSQVKNKNHYKIKKLFYFFFLQKLIHGIGRVMIVISKLRIIMNPSMKLSVEFFIAFLENSKKKRCIQKKLKKSNF